MPDLIDTTYTNEDGEQCNALAYLLEDGAGLRCFSRYGATTADCAPVALLLFNVMAHHSGEDTVHGLDGDMSAVVNESDDVTWTILDNAHVFEGWTYDGEPLDVSSFFDEDTVDEARELYALAYDGEPAHF